MWERQARMSFSHLALLPNSLLLTLIGWDWWGLDGEVTISMLVR